MGKRQSGILIMDKLQEYIKEIENKPEMRQVVEELKNITTEGSEVKEPENTKSDNSDTMTAVEQKEYKTLKKAGKTAILPENMALITNQQYGNALSLFKSGDAYLQPIRPDLVDSISYDPETGIFTIKDIASSEARFKTTFSDSVPKNIDLTFLQLCFSIILKNFSVTMLEDNSLNLVVSIYYPALAKILGNERNTSRGYVEAFIAKILEFQNLIGIVNGEIQPVLIYAGEDEEKGIVRLSSPYLTRVINKVYGASIRTDRNGNPKLKKNGEPLMLPSYSYLIHSSLARERNKYAAENVRIIISLIEQAGDNIPHIKASNIVERNVQLATSINEMSDTSNINQTLKRTFKKTWELLRSQTDIQKVYKDIQLPEPTDPKYLPTYRNLEKTVFEFPHKGKKGYR